LLKKSIAIIISVLLLIGMIGCKANDQSAKEIMLEGIEKSKEINRYTFHGKVDISIVQNENSDLDLFAFINGLTDFQIKVEGRESLEPAALEADVKIETGNQEKQINVDTIFMIKNGMLYVKIPSIFTAYKQEQSKEYIAIKLNQQEQKQKEESISVLKSIINRVDKKAFHQEDSSQYTINKGKIKEVVHLTIKQEDLQTILKAFIKNSAPILIERLEKNAITDQQKKIVQAWRKKLENQEIDQLVSEYVQRLTIYRFELIQMYDQAGFTRKSLIDADVAIQSVDGEKTRLIIHVEENINDINQEIPFVIPIPSKEQIFYIDETKQKGPFYYLGM